ncbi:metallophosphoesterase [Kocuria coralli]|uniref:Metallophosphoesterase n=1 Tax=Kocuria coralli TaxID=1461025 RepID=A0A5J5L0E1_9MICC|nr:metallophosphoesterase [Kocuria coralli]KAA9395322.1 metallophosphoesterase [Kocuria coralli]
MPAASTIAAVAATSVAATAVSGTALAAWGVFGERRRFRVRHETLPVLAPGHPDLRVLHISDLHTIPGQEAKKRFVHGLADLNPDLVLDTGDNLSHPDAVPYLLEIMEPLLAFPGLYVPGSNCYFAPMLKNPARYLWKSSTSGEDRSAARILPWRQMHRAFDEAGWVGMINRADRVRVGDHVIEVSGVDDPHLGFDRHPGFLAPGQPGSGLGNFADAGSAPAALRLGLTHAPYLRALNRFAEDRADLVVAGHTHGGQVCLPGGRALVSNCDIEPSRCKGVTSQGGVPVQISAGLGESRFAPIRLFCPPEAVLMTLTARA